MDLIFRNVGGSLEQEQKKQTNIPNRSTEVICNCISSIRTSSISMQYLYSIPLFNLHLNSIPENLFINNLLIFSAYKNIIVSIKVLTFLINDLLK